MVRVFFNGPGDEGSIKKWYLIPFFLTHSIIRYGSKVSVVIQGKEWRHPLHLGVVAIEERAFGSPATTIGQLGKKSQDKITWFTTKRILKIQKTFRVFPTLDKKLTKKFVLINHLKTIQNALHTGDINLLFTFIQKTTLVLSWVSILSIPFEKYCSFLVTPTYMTMHYITVGTS